MQILAGPILRHANSQEINIWLTLDEKATTIDGEIIDAAGNVVGSSVAETQKPIQAGQHVFVYLLKLTPKTGSFVSDKILNYDLIINNQRLADFGLTRGDYRITYGNDTLPGFILKNKHQVILQGSCRKPHAAVSRKSQPDMMKAADTLLQETRKNTAKRPSLLFLTGDQIYADDVSAPLLAKIKQMLKKYIGYDQQIPKTAKTNVNVAKLDLNGRADLLSAKGLGFSSSQKKNHLLSFGEFFMMYCVVWGGVEAKCPIFSEIQRDLAQRGYEGELDELESDYWSERIIVEGFLQEAIPVRRLLANIPTYMIFDDHDVTDDWNLDEGIYNAFRTQIFSRHVQTNALAAYWLWQGWGNDPDSYNQAFKRKIQQYLNGYPEDKFAQLESALLDRYWGYEIDTSPYIVVLDTRTKREFKSGKLVKLMSTQSLADVAAHLIALPEDKKKGNSLLLVSPSPVYGFTELEHKILAAASHESFRRGLDVECWIANEMGFKQLQSTLLESGFDSCAIFSGDVHFGFCRYECLVSSSGSEMRIYQLTSSSLHNAPGILKGLGLNILEKEAFIRHHTGYLIPENSDDNFVNSSTNLGILEINQGKPEIFYLLDSNTAVNVTNTSAWLVNKNKSAWLYNLAKPRVLQ